jgi:hypothetical protein
MIDAIIWENLRYQASLLRMKGDVENSDLLLEAAKSYSVDILMRNHLFAAIIKATKAEINENSSHWDI